MKIKDVGLLDEFVPVKGDLSTGEAAEQFYMKGYKVLLVVDDRERPQGVAAFAQFLSAVIEGRDPTKTRLSEIMKKLDVTVDVECDVEEAVRKMLYEAHFKALPVMKNNRIIGLVTIDHIFAALSRSETQHRLGTG